ncbi:MAG: hypothetical protein ACM3XM_06750 [Mycobacterium leprae]
MMIVQVKTNDMSGIQGVGYATIWNVTSSHKSSTGVGSSTGDSSSMSTFIGMVQDADLFDSPTWNSTGGDISLAGAAPPWTAAAPQPWVTGP